jgi:SSS family solute:Na+ symporter
MTDFVGKPIDLVVMVVYFVAILGFGSFFGRYTRGTRDFFFGGQRFSWWLIAMSCVATVVGSYSFIKYSTQGFDYGLSSSMTYLNDWFIVPLFVFGWLPIIYFSRVASVPEYFERRFNQSTRVVATAFVLLYLVGYIGINLLTLGVAMETLLGLDFTTCVVAIAGISAIYVTAGGQTAVIMTDLAQGFLLLIAGLLLFGLGLWAVGGPSAFWSHLTVSQRMPFSGLTEPEAFPAAGIFFQDGLANSAALYLMNQGMIMRFLAVKSVNDGRKAMFAIVLVLMPLAMLAVANAGWLGRVMVKVDLIPADSDPDAIFVIVADKLCNVPGLFGLIMAALTAALMSTVDTLINATSAVFVNDVWRRYVKPEASDRHHLRVARICSVVATGIGLAMVPVMLKQGSIYDAHGMFTAAVTPPMVMAIVLGIFWRRYNGQGALATLIGGGLMIAASLKWADGILGFEIAGWPVFSLGIGSGGYKFIRAWYGLLVSGLLGVVVSLLFAPQPYDRLKGLVVGSIRDGARQFKGSEPKASRGVRVVGRLTIHDAVTDGEVALSASVMKQLGAEPGDLLYVADARRWLGGLRSAHLRAAVPHVVEEEVRLRDATLSDAMLDPRRAVRVELIL